MEVCGGRRQAFTLIELLVVVAVIALLIAILLPSLSMAKARSKTTACASNMRQLGTAFQAFGTEYSGHLPGCASQFVGDFNVNDLNNAWKLCWLAGGTNPLNSYTAADQANSTGFFSQPTKGTIYPYVKTAKVYRCPAQDLVKLDSGIGSNGQYDYSMPQLLSGSFAHSIGRLSTVKNLGGTGPSQVSVATPLLVEEDPTYYINSHQYEDGAWCWHDIYATVHQKGANILAIDSSVYWNRWPTGFTMEAGSLLMTAPSGAQIDGYRNTCPFGWLSMQ
jgi:prepilin-type N-terminal cleavage/methylation domain-containing protein